MKGPLSNNNSRVIAIVIGIIIAAGAVGGLFIIIRSNPSLVNSTGGQTIPVVEAAIEIPGGSAITAQQLQVVQVAASIVPANIIANPAKIVGQYAILAITPNQMVTSNLLSPTKTAGIQVVCLPQASLPPTLITSPTPSASAHPSSPTSGQVGCREEAFSLPSGFVAMAIPMNDTEGVGGFLQAGDQINILADVNGQGSVKIIAHNVSILNVGTVGQTGSGTATELVVGVPSAEADQLAYIMDTRNPTQSTILDYTLISNSDYNAYGSSPSAAPDPGVNAGSFQQLYG